VTAKGRVAIGRWPLPAERWELTAAAFFFEQLMGPRSLLLTGTLPLLVGMGLAYSQHGTWSWPVALAAMVAAVCGVQAGMMLDDLADHEGDATNVDRVDGLSGGGRGLTDGAVSRTTVLVVGAVVAAVAVGAALAVAVVSPATLPIAAIAVTVAVVYSVGPRLVKHGLGDGVAFFAFGPLPILFGYAAMAGVIDPAAIGVAAAFGATTVVGCAGMHLLDLDSDSAVGKRTLAVRAGRTRIVALMAAAQLTGVAGLVAATAVGILPAAPAAVAVVAIPALAYALVRMARGDRRGEVLGETVLLAVNTVVHLVAAIALVAGVGGSAVLVVAVTVLTAVTIGLQIHVLGRFVKARGEAHVHVEGPSKVRHEPLLALVAGGGRSLPVKTRSRRAAVDTRIPLLLRGVELPGEQRHPTDIDLDVRAGELVAVDAPESVCDALQRLTRGDAVPSAGEVHFMGRDLTTFRKRELDRLRQRFLGVVTALPFVDNTVDVRGNLEYVLLLRGLDAAEIRDTIDDAVDGLPLRDKLGHRFTDLTLSETRWFVLLRGLLMRPQLLLIEAGALDSSSDLAEKAAAHVRYHIRGTETGVLWTTTSVRAACAADRMFIYTMGNLVDADDQSGNTPYRVER